MIENNRVAEIRHRVLEALGSEFGEQDGMKHVLQALEDALVFHMALICPGCRKQVANKLRADIPRMLALAGNMAATVQQRFGEQHWQQ
jgi:hypothetical protein